MRSLFAFLVLCTAAQAEIITAPFAGTVTQVIGMPFGIQAPVGTLVAGSFKYNTAMSPSISSEPGSADFLTAITNGFVMNVGGVSITSWSYNVTSRNEKPFGLNADLFGVQADDDQNGNDFRVNGVGAQGSATVVLIDTDHTMFLQDDDVLMLPSQDELNQIEGVFFGQLNDEVGNSIVFRTIPEPSVIFLLAQSLLMGARRRRRSGSDLNAMGPSA